MLGLLGQLVDKSLVERLPDVPADHLVAGSLSETSPRFHMLYPIRQYGQALLAESGEGKALAARHIDYFLAFSLEAEPALRGNGIRVWNKRVTADLDNLRLAMERSLAGQVEKGLRIITAFMVVLGGSRQSPEGMVGMVGKAVNR